MGTLIDVPAHSFSVMGRGSTQEPPCRFLHFHCTVAAIYVGWRFICHFLESGFIYVRYFRETYTLFAKYSHEIYFKSNYLGLLHVTGLSSWWISSKIQFCLVYYLWWLRQGAIGPLEATLFRVNVDWSDYGIDNFNLVIRLRKAEQLAFRFSFFSRFAMSRWSSCPSEPW